VNELSTSNAGETFSCGALMGEMLAPGDFVALVGELGAGKTEFVKGVACGLDVPSDEPVTSPTYPLLNIHHGRLQLYHFDLYRLSGSREITELGFEEYFSAQGVCLVEWAERLGELLPAEHLVVCLDVIAPDKRLLRFIPTGNRAEILVRQLMARCQ